MVKTIPINLDKKTTKMPIELLKDSQFKYHINYYF
jgi:hypothetical protein